MKIRVAPGAVPSKDWTQGKPMANYKPGDFVVFTRDKCSASPGKRARNISPARLGEFYKYEVDKYWTIQSVNPKDQTVRAVTRGGKLHTIKIADPRLRKANVWERIVRNSRFPRSEGQRSPNVPQNANSPAR